MIRVLAFVAVVCCGLCQTAIGALADCIDATCRVTTMDGSCGTGCVCEVGPDAIFVLTAAHVVGNQSAAACEFWREGHTSVRLPGRVVARVDNNETDAAVIAVGKDSLGGWLPKAIPLAPPNYAIRPGDALVSVGCANGNWSTGWKGHALGCSGSELRFVPAPANGRSGSAVFNAEGTCIVGLIRARTMDSQEGIACGLGAIYRDLVQVSGEIRSQCGPNGCPGTPPYRLLPYRQQQEYLNRQPPAPQTTPNANPWPTLPPSAPAPTPAPAPAPIIERVDLSETHKKLDRIADLLSEMQKRPEPEKPVTPQAPATPPQPVPVPLPGPVVAPAPAPVPVPAKPEPDPRVEQVEKTAKQTGEAVVEVKAEQSKLRQGLEGLHTAVQKLVGDVTTIPERIQTRIEKVKAEGAESTGEVARAYVKDLLKEKLADGTVGWTAGQAAAAALGLGTPIGLALAGGLWIVSRQISSKVQSGEPLLVQQLVGRITDKIEDIKSRISQPKQG